MKQLKEIRFFPMIAAVMLIVNFIGFAPSYFLKPMMESPELPFRTHIHGLFFTGWFVLFFVQVLLVKKGNIPLHQTLGKVGGLLAIIMTFSALQIIYYRVLEYDGSEGSLANTALVFIGNMVLILMFTIAVAMGITFRRRPKWHKRLMLLACISMMPQSLGRIGKMPSTTLLGDLPNEVLFGLGGMLFLIFSLWVHDLIHSKRLHPVSFVGGPLIMVLMILGTIVLPNLQFVKDFIVWLN